MEVVTSLIIPGTQLHTYETKLRGSYFDCADQHRCDSQTMGSTGCEYKLFSASYTYYLFGSLLSLINTLTVAGINDQGVSGPSLEPTKHTQHQEGLSI